jgi:hypothetical protein
MPCVDAASTPPVVLCPQDTDRATPFLSSAPPRAPLPSARWQHQPYAAVITAAPNHHHYHHHHHQHHLYRHQGDQSSSQRPASVSLAAVAYDAAWHRLPEPAIAAPLCGPRTPLQLPGTPYAANDETPTPCNTPTSPSEIAFAPLTPCASVATAPVLSRNPSFVRSRHDPYSPPVTPAMRACTWNTTPPGTTPVLQGTTTDAQTPPPPPPPPPPPSPPFATPEWVGTLRDAVLDNIRRLQLPGTATAHSVSNLRLMHLLKDRHPTAIAELLESESRAGIKCPFQRFLRAHCGIGTVTYSFDQQSELYPAIAPDDKRVFALQSPHESDASLRARAFETDKALLLPLALQMVGDIAAFTTRHVLERDKGGVQRFERPSVSLSLLKTHARRTTIHRFSSLHSEYVAFGSNRIETLLETFVPLVVAAVQATVRLQPTAAAAGDGALIECIKQTCIRMVPGTKPQRGGYRPTFPVTFCDPPIPLSLPPQPPFHHCYGAPPMIVTVHS